MKAIRTLWRTEEVEVERQVTVTETVEQDKKFMVVELSEDDVNMISRLLSITLRQNGTVQEYRACSSMMQGWPKFVKKIEKAWDK